MTWNVVFARHAQRALKKIPKADVIRILDATTEMQNNPFVGDIRALGGKHRGSFRRRVGSWRIFFDVDPESKTVSVTSISRRSSTTY